MSVWASVRASVVCECVSVYEHMYVSVCLCVWECMSVSLCVSLGTCVREYTHVHEYTSGCGCMREGNHVCACMCVHVGTSRA